MVETECVADLVDDDHETVLSHVGVGEGAIGRIEPDRPLRLFPAIGVGVGGGVGVNVGVRVGVGVNVGVAVGVGVGCGVGCWVGVGCGATKSNVNASAWSPVATASARPCRVCIP